MSKHLSLKLNATTILKFMFKKCKFEIWINFFCHSLFWAACLKHCFFNIWAAYLKHCFLLLTSYNDKIITYIYIYNISYIKYYWGILSSVSFFDDIKFFCLGLARFCILLCFQLFFNQRCLIWPP